MIRVGLGFDAHAFDATRALILGGVTIPDSPGLTGHSDADVLSHAVADALLGAARLGDLGARFPDEERWRDASSLDILKETARLLRAERWSIASVDATVVAEAPRIDRHRDQMILNIAGALGVYSGELSVKATTSDGMGFTGRKEGIAALAVAALYRADPEPPK